MLWTSALLCVQDNVPAFPSAEAVAIIERNLGGKLLDKFDSFTMEPIAAASLGQVPYECRPFFRHVCCKSGTGTTLMPSFLWACLLLV